LYLNIKLKHIARIEGNVTRCCVSR